MAITARGVTSVPAGESVEFTSWIHAGGISKPDRLASFLKHTAENAAIIHFRKEQRYPLVACPYGPRKTDR